MPEIDTSNLADTRTYPRRYEVQPAPVLVFAQEGRELYRCDGYDVCVCRGHVFVRFHADATAAKGA